MHDEITLGLNKSTGILDNIYLAVALFAFSSAVHRFQRFLNAFPSATFFPPLFWI
jgi:hypothetical protein